MNLSRRDFIHSGCMIATAMLASGYLDRLEAGLIHRNGGTPKIQVGQSGLGVGQFKNFMTALSGLTPGTAGYAYPSILNVDQYPTGTIGSGLNGVFPVPSNVTSATTCVIAWTGTVSAGGMGIVYGSPGFTVTVGAGFVSGGTSFNLFVTGTNGYIEFNWNGSIPPSQTFTFVNGATFTGLSGLIICAKSDYASIVAAANAGQLISSAYVNDLKALHPKFIRPMSWVQPNGNNFTQHKYRLNWQTALFYGGAWIPNCWAGTSGGTNAYTCSNAIDSPGAYTMGEVLQLQFVNASTTGSLTINRNSLGAVPLFDMSGNALTGTAVAANTLATLIYDDLLGGYLTNLGGGLSCNIPVETIVGLANQAGVPLWYNIQPHLTNASVTSVVTYIAGALNNGCYFEYANEVWNTSGGFSQTAWASNCGQTLGFPSGNNRYFYGFYGLKLAQLMPLVVTAWGAKAGLKCVCAFQAFGPTGTSGSTNLYRLQGADLSTGLGYTKYNSYVGVSYNASPNRPVDVSDVLSYATYYSGAQCANFDQNYSNSGGTGLTTGGPSSGPGSSLNGLLGAADAFASGDTTNSIAWLDWDIRQGTNNGTAGGQTLLALKNGVAGIGIYPPWETIAASYDGSRPSGKSNLTVDLYEGAMECAPPSTNECTTLGISTTYGGATGKIGNLLTAYKNSSLFYATVQQQFADFFAQSHSKTASWFVMDGSSQWSLYQGDIYTSQWQSYPAVQAYNQTP